MNTAKKKIGVTLPPELHAKVKSAAPLRGLNVEQAYEQALQHWLDPDGRDKAQISPAEAAVVARVLAVLRSGNRDAIKGLHAALDRRDAPGGIREGKAEVILRQPAAA